MGEKEFSDVILLRDTNLITIYCLNRIYENSRHQLRSHNTSDKNSHIEMVRKTIIFYP